jgi:hypothetical protein
MIGINRLDSEIAAELSLVERSTLVVIKMELRASGNHVVIHVTLRHRACCS